MAIKRFNEFFDLGQDSIWGRGKVGQTVLDKAKARSVSRAEKEVGLKNNKYSDNWKEREKQQVAFATKLKPEDLYKHTIKPLSEEKHHKDYTVHHLNSNSSGGGYDTALLHHKTKGFIGLINGHKTSQGLHVSESFISPLHRGKGLGVALYNHVANHHGGVVSDSSLTTHSQKIYGHFAKEGRVKVHMDRFEDHPTIKHGDPVSVKTKEGRKYGLGKKKKMPDRLIFSTPNHSDLASTSAAQLRIEPTISNKKSKK